MADIQYKEKKWIGSEGIEKKGFERADRLALAAIILLYSFVSLFGLGSRQMPQTAAHLIPDSGGSHEIILDLGKQSKLDAVYIHLGHMLDRVVAISYYDEEAGGWLPLQEEVELQANYNWNKVIVNKEIRYLGIVSRSGKAVFHEMVLLDTAGNRLLPKNHEEYPLLFDEQELFFDELTYYYRTMFDEVYYAGSAYEFLNGLEMFEETHPPMGKILIAVGEWIFGINPFGWRISCAVFGILMLPLICWFLYRIFKNSRIALIGTVLLSLDFMHFTLSRIATLDTIIAFFILAMFAFMWKIVEIAKEEKKADRRRPSKRMSLWMTGCAVFTGIGVATKWTGFYAMAGIACIFLGVIFREIVQDSRKKSSKAYSLWLLGEGVLIFGIIPVSIYTLSFLPQTIATGKSNVFKVMWDSSVFMLNFHRSIVFEHPYESPWYTWPWIRTPLVDAVNSLKDGMCSIVVTMGNPIIWWFGFAAFFHMLYRLVCKRDRKAGYLIYAYLVMYVPWFFVNRTVFIYQYYGSSLFMICMLAYSLYLFGQRRKKLIPVFLEVSLFIFILFYPLISGFEVSPYYIETWLEWLPTWNFTGV